MSPTVPPDLPVLPVPRARATVLLWNPDASLDHFASVVEGDPALTAAVVRAANATDSWNLPPVGAAGEAINRIGVEATRQLVGAAVVRSQFDRLRESGIDTDEFWRHVVAVALLAERGTRERAARPAAFTAGLMHDVGRLALAASSPSRYSVIIDAVRAGARVSDEERRAFGIDHATLGAQVCEQWRLPEEIVDAVGAHHSDAPPLAKIVRRARRAAAAAGIGDGIAEGVVGDKEDRLLARVGGRDGLLDAVGAFRRATSSRSEAAA